MKLGMFGGAFDPPHRAHRALAQVAIEQLELDELRVFPTGNAWHKTRTLTPAEHRLAMVKLAFEGLQKVVIDERELKRGGATYTVDTLRELQAEHPGAQLYLVMGEDQSSAFTTWREWEAIAAMATIAVAERPRSDAKPLPGAVRMVLLQLPPMDDSATDIRSRLAAGGDVSQLVPAGVAGYIARHHLYRTPE